LIIVDAYCHLGECCVYDQMVYESEIVEGLNANRVSAVIVSPFPGVPNPAQAHDDIANLASRYPGRVFGLVQVNPHIHRDHYRAEVDRCVRQLGFVGVVLHTLGHAVNPAGRDAQTVFEVARELTVPVVVHTGTGIPWGLPTAVLPRAREFADVKIVLAHAGAGLYTEEALLVARECSNVYLETSGCRADDVKRIINDLGGTRVLFGSNLASEQAAELAKYRALGLYQFQQFLFFGQAATDVYGLHGVPDVSEVATSAAT
jgi:predicted TIM-barrel fold metal-dependent hydrolase